MTDKADVVIIGGGLAGLTAAIHLSQARLKVTVVEKNDFPKHKVCGEYISNEILPYLDALGIDLHELKSVNITRTSISTLSGKQIFGKLPLGGFGLSRYSLDEFLFRKAIASGCNLIQDTATDVSFADNTFTIQTSDNGAIKAEIVIGAFGKRSNIDQKLGREFITQKSPWLAVKAHYSGAFPDDLVSLHNFKGGYCGVSKVENDAINICYLADYDSFKKHKDIHEFQREVLSKNPFLKTIFESCKLMFEKPITISQISFAKKNVVDNHILMTGDTAGLIHPLCGNGMAMAVHSAKIASELVLQYFNGTLSREMMERRYAKTWNGNFKRRMMMGNFLAKILRKERLSGLLMNTLIRFPFIFSEIIKGTHGKPITQSR